MKKWIQRKEKGQVLVILMIGVTALLAFTALAIDTGQFYSDRRYDQNAADGSAFAGGGAAGNTFVANNVTYTNFNCTDADGDYTFDDADIQAAVDAAIAEAQSRAAVNNFGTLPAFDTEADLIAAGHGVWVECVVEGTYLGDKYLAVHVMVTSYVQTAFAHMFFGSELRNTVEAVTKVEVPEGVGRGLAIVALNEEGCGGNDGGLFFTGTGTVTITDSGAHSNACMDCSGTATVTTQTDPETGLPFPLTYMMLPKGTQCSGISPEPVPATEPIAPTYLDMTGLCGPAQTVPAAVDNVVTISPGTYDRIRVNNVNHTLEMNPGLYCVNGDFTVNGEGVVVSSYDPSSIPGEVQNPGDYDGVTIYAVGGDVSINGTANVILVAPKMIPDGSGGYNEPPNLGNAIPGMLFYVDPANPKPNIILNGGANTFVRGTILNPDGQVSISGNSDNEHWYAQVIADEIFLGGTATLNITYNGDDFYWGEAFLGLEK